MPTITYETRKKPTFYTEYKESSYISNITLNGHTYAIKDEEARNMIDRYNELFQFDKGLKEIESLVEREREERLKREKREKEETYDKNIRKRPYIGAWKARECNGEYYGLNESVWIDRVKIDGLWTIIFWSDGVVSKAKCSLDDEFDPEVGIMVAICNRIFRTPQNFKKILKNLLKDAEVPKTGWR